MTSILAGKIMYTAMISTFIFIAAIKFHGDEEPQFKIKVFEIFGVLFSGFIFIVFSLLSIWID